MNKLLFKACMKTDQKEKLLAKADAYTKAAYFLYNHVVRSDDSLVSAAAHELADGLKKSAAEFTAKATE